MSAQNTDQSITQGTFQGRARRAGAVAVIALIAAAGVSVAASPAHAGSESAIFVSEADGVTTRTVQATVIEDSLPRDQRLRPGWYVCDSKVERSSLTVVDRVDLILGDNCELTITNTSGEIGSGAGILVPQDSSLTIWSGKQNTGRLVATGAPFSAGIGGSGASAAYEKRNIVSGDIRITGGTVIATGGVGAAGIGGSVYQANGRISLDWRANVLARGGNAHDSLLYTRGTLAERSSGLMPGMGGGPGIGSGASSYGDGRLGVGSDRGMEIHTSGIVQAIGGKATARFGAGADIGRGGSSNSTNGFSFQPTVALTEVAVANGGSVNMKDVNQTFVKAAPISNLAAGSTVTFQAVPDTGMKLEGARWQDLEMARSGTGLAQFKILPNTRDSRASFSFAPSVQLSAAQQELTQRIGQLPDTITSVADADQVAAVTALWLALSEAERATLPLLSSNRLQGAQQQAAAVNHASKDGHIRVESAALDWNVRLIANRVDDESAEYVAARAALADDRLLIGIADIRYVDTLTGSDVTPGADAIGTLSIAGMNLRAYDDVAVQRAGEAATISASATPDETLRIESIAAGRYTITGHNVSDGGAGKGSAAAQPPVIVIALLVGIAALGAGAYVSHARLRRNLLAVGKS